ncbi:hypothetical protein H5410_061840 [Solanum commersonii]|uniref:Uncharacterized protein n=1 Tax=Solanum commersonii TaxID=4109 RepID=A0A9J5W943_SOLCO|nr:hypothetical protein H5410_061840 [Solanum commersonii]
MKVDYVLNYRDQEPLWNWKSEMAYKNHCGTGAQNYYAKETQATRCVGLTKKFESQEESCEASKENGIHLQEEIITDILSKLHVRSLLQYKCVDIDIEPYFTMKHFNHGKNNQHSPKILVLNIKFPSYYSSLSVVQLVEDVQKHDLPSNHRP